MNAERERLARLAREANNLWNLVDTANRLVYALGSQARAKDLEYKEEHEKWETSVTRCDIGDAPCH